MKVNSLNDKIGCIFLPSDDYEVEFDLKSTDTIHDLKLKFEEEEGIPPEHQSYFSGPVELEDKTFVSTFGWGLRQHIGRQAQEGGHDEHQPR